MHRKLLIVIALLALPLGCTHATEPADKGSARSLGKPMHPIQVEVVNQEALKAGVESEASIVVRSARDIESMEVRLVPPSGMVLAEDRFQHYRPDFVAGTVKLPLRFRPASDGPQRLKVEVRAVDTSGRAMSRTVDVSLGLDDSDGRGKTARRVEAPEDQSRADEDAVVKGEQEIRRKN